MRTSVIVTFIGDDQPGLIERISDAVERRQGNWLESRMNKLAGKFAGIVQVEVDSERVDELTSALRALEETGIHLLIEEGAAAESDAPTRIVRLTLLGLDRPGIVHEVSHALARQFINVAEMSTDITTAAMTGELLFNAEASIEVPEIVDLVRLEEQLEAMGNELAVDIDLLLDSD